MQKCRQARCRSSHHVWIGSFTRGQTWLMSNNTRVAFGSTSARLSGVTNLLVTRQSAGHDCHNTAMPEYIISTYGDMPLSQVLGDIGHFEHQHKPSLQLLSREAKSISLNKRMTIPGGICGRRMQWQTVYHGM